MTHLDYVSNWYDFVIQLNEDISGLLPVIQKKSRVLQDVINEKKPNAKTILAFGLVPELINLELNNCSVTIIEPSPAACEFADTLYNALGKTGVIKHKLKDDDKDYDVVLGLNQYITYLDSDQKQQEHISKVFELLKPGGMYLSTIRDYKNIRTNKFVDEVFTLNNHYIMETRQWKNQTNYTKTVMVITKHKNSTELLEIGPVDRKIIMFKDLARLCTANGGKNFQVHQNKIYKPLYSKTMHHIITMEKE